MIKLLLGLISLLLLAGTGLALLIRALEPRLLFHPDPAETPTPAQAGLPYEEVRLPTPDGEVLRGWWIPRPEPEAPLLLFFHGNAGSRAHRVPNLELLWRAGISVFIFDYRGYGGSSGHPNETGVITDGLAAHDWLTARLPGRPVVLFGRSLGGAIAAQVALRRPVSGLILESTFTSVSAMARTVSPLPGLHRLLRTRLDTLAAVRSLTLPLLVIHGKADELVPYAMGEALFSASASPLKTLHSVPGGTHNDTYLQAGSAYSQWIGAFLKSLRPPA
ncbi:MAG: lysophospholipase [Deltaproteobacteria bacterium]|nr:lysophospholipase [Deltaproteobacteria bacterium]